MNDMDGLCDVKGCQSLPLLGWRPLTERIGRKICEQHWRRHQNKQDSFDLFEAFGFRRPTGKPKLAAKKDVACCACGQQRERGHTYCQSCAQARQRHVHQQRQKRYRQRQAQAVPA